MIHLTIGDLIDGKGYDLDTDGHSLYAVHDGDVVFYVGRSKCPITRLSDHVYAPTQFGYLIRDNLPISRDWTATLLTPGDCGGESRTGSAEIALIRFCKPCLNCTYNTEPSALPERYGPTAADIEAQRAATRLIHVPYKRRVMV